MVLDFARVRYVGSAMLGTLVRLQKRLVARGGSLRLCSIPAVLADMFTLTRLDRILDVYRDRQTATTT